MFNFLKVIPAILQFITIAIEKYNKSKLEDKLEEVKSDPATGWVDGFGMRREKDSDPSSSHPK